MKENTNDNLLINLLKNKEISLDKESISSLQNIFKLKSIKKKIKS